MVNELFVSLGLDKHEWLEDIKRGESSLASFLACIEESIREREDRQFEEGLNSRVKFDVYKKFGMEVTCSHLNKKTIFQVVPPLNRKIAHTFQMWQKHASCTCRKFRKMCRKYSCKMQMCQKKWNAW